MDDARAWVGGGLLSVTDATGRRRWDLPLSRQMQVLPLGDRLAICQEGRVWFHGTTDGELAAVWPPAGSDAGWAYQMTPAGAAAVVLTSARLSEWYSRAWRLAANGTATALGRVPLGPSQVESLHLLDGGALLASQLSQGRAWLLRPPAATGPAQYSQVRYWGLTQRHSAVFSGPGGRGVVTDRHLQHLWLCRGTEISYWPVAPRPVLDTAVDDLLAAGWPACDWLCEPQSGRALPLGAQNVAAVVVRGTTVRGIKVPPKESTATPIAGDLAQGTELVAGPPFALPSATPTPVGTLRVQDRDYLFFAYSPSSVGLHALEYAPGATVPLLRTLPYLRGTLGPVSPTLWRAGDELYPLADFAALLDVSPTVQTLPPLVAQRPVLDGFLDEWTPTEFLPMATGRFALRVGANRREGWLALDVTDAKLVERLAATGLDGNTFALIVGGRAGSFIYDDPVGWPSHRRLTRQTDDPSWQFAFALAPDASRATLELYRDQLSSVPLPPDKPTPESEAAARQFGELALRVLYRVDPGAPVVNLSARAERGPQSFLRVRFAPPPPLPPPPSAKP